MALKDTKLNEKEQFVVKGDILADSFRDRQTGELLKSYSEAELDGEIEQVIDDSLLNGSLKTVLQNKSLGVSEFPLTSDIDNQHLTVNAGLLPNGNMEDLTESDISKLTLTLNRVINKGWLKTGTVGAVKITKVTYDPTIISIVASSVVFSAEGIVSGKSYLITLDVANTSYSYSEGTYNP